MIPFYGNKAPKFAIPSQPDLEKALNLISDRVDLVDSLVPRILSGEGISVGTYDGAVTISSTKSNVEKDDVRFRILLDSLEDGTSIIRIGAGTIAIVNNGVVNPIAPKIKDKYNYNISDPVYDTAFGPYFLASEAFSKTGIYIKITALNGEYSAEVILHDKSKSDNPDFEAEAIYFEIGTINYNTASVYVQQKWESDIFLSSDVKECPFMLSDVTAYGKDNTSPDLTVKVKTSLVYEGVGKSQGRYPKGMGPKWNYEIPQESIAEWQAVYVVMEFDRATRRLKEYEDAIYISFEKEYKENTTTLQYELIGEVSKGKKVVDKVETQEIVINYISNVCQEVVPDFNKLVEYCPFFVKDASERDEDGTVKKVQISIKPEYVEGRLPLGMVWDKDFILEVEDPVLGRGKFNVYLKMMLDETGTLGDYPEALSIQLTKYERSSGSAIKWYLIAQVFTIGYGSGNDDAPLDVIDYVKNMCPSAFSDLPNACSFEVEDASDDEGIKTQIRIGQLDGKRYPDGMVEGKPYQIVVPDPAVDWYAIYIQVLLNGNSEIDGEYGDESVTISYETDYKKSTALVEWILIGEITISSRDGIDKDEGLNDGRYISYIQNYCNKAEIPKKSGCYFEVLDASEAPDNLSILVRNDTVNWSDRYPDKMALDTTYTMPLDKDETWYVVYVVMDVDPETGNIKGDKQNGDYKEGYCYLELSTEYIPYKKDTKYYFQIAEINIGKDDESKSVIDLISNTCLVPNYSVEAKYCPFTVSDRSTYDSENKATDCVIKIQNDTVEGFRYPKGMAKDSEYILKIENNQISKAGVCYIFLRLEFDENGKLEDYEEAITFQPSSTYLVSGARTKFILVASVETEDGGKMVPNKIINRCPDSPLSLMEACPFQIEDHSYNGNDIKVLVNNGKIDGTYPIGMVEGGRYVLDLSTSSGHRWYAIYAVSKLNYFGGVDYDSNKDYILIKAFEDYQKSNPYYQYDLLGEVSISSDEADGFYISNIINYCYTPKILVSSSCPFECIDATMNGTAGIVIRNGKIEDQYPQYMKFNTIYYVPTPDLWNAVYAVFKTDSAGNLRTGADSIFFKVSPDELHNTSEFTYELIAEVNVEKVGQTTEVTFIKNYCYEPYLVKKDYCPLKISDYSTYNNEGVPSNCRVLIQNDMVDGRWPKGMDGVAPYVLTITEKDVDETGACNIYLRLEVDVEGNLETYDDALTFQPSNSYLDSGARTQFILIGTVYTIGGVIIPNKLVSYCTLPTVQDKKVCNFEVEDASKAGVAIVLLNNGKVDDAYPSKKGSSPRVTMDETSRFEIRLPSSEGWYAIYAVSRLDVYGATDYEKEDFLEIAVYEKYRRNTAYHQYDILAEVTVSEDGNGGLYISHIKNYCNTPQVTSSLNCPFECIDATNEDGQQDVAGVVIRNGKIENIWPSEMEEDTFYYIQTTHSINYVYAVLKLKEDGTFEGLNGSVYFESHNTYQKNSDVYNYQLIAEVKTKSGGVTSIKNYCYDPYLTEKNTGTVETACRFKVRDATNYATDNTNPDLQVTVAPDLVDQRFPDGMSLGGTAFILQIDVSAFIYCKLQYKEDDIVLDENEDAITILQSEEVMKNTETEEYVLIAIVNVVNGKINSIVNNCTAVIPNPCLLSWK